MYRPEPAELGELAEQYGLPELAVEDAIKAHQRPKFERYGDTLFVVLKAARYLDAREEVEFGELHLFLGGDFVITVRHSESPDLARVRRRLESSLPETDWRFGYPVALCLMGLVSVVLYVVFKRRDWI